MSNYTTYKVITLIASANHNKFIEIRRYDYDDKLYEWCCDTFGKPQPDSTWWLKKHKGTSPHTFEVHCYYNLYFANPEDAALFKITWG